MRIRLLYFTGTGSTRLVAETIAAKLADLGQTTELCRIWRGEWPPVSGFDRLLILYPVHAGNPPRPVLQMIRSLPAETACPTTLVCVSGGGEGLVNSGSREWAIELLQKRQYPVIAEYHVVMPANCLTETPFLLACELLAALPIKAERIARGVCRDRPVRLPASVVGRLVSRGGRQEQKEAWQFGRRMQVAANCTGCGQCAAVCPEANIEMAAGRPLFAERCVMCLACINSCPVKALLPGRLGFVATRGSYDLEHWQAVAALRPRLTAAEIHQLTNSPLWRPVGKYLLDLLPANGYNEIR